MAVSMVKVAPSALILAAAAYTAWPHIGAPSTAPPKRSSPVEEIVDALIWPSVGKPHERDPFLDSQSVKAAAAAQMRTMLQSLTKSLVARAVPSVARGGARGNTLQGIPTPPAAHEPESPADDPRSQLTLKATYVQGKHRIAMIGDRLYEPGEAVRGLSAEQGRCVLEEVRPHSVVLRYRGRHLVLDYPGLDAPPPASRPAPPAEGLPDGADGLNEVLGIDAMSLLGGSPLTGPRPGSLPARRRAGRD